MRTYIANLSHNSVLLRYNKIVIAIIRLSWRMK